MFLSFLTDYADYGSYDPATAGAMAAFSVVYLVVCLIVAVIGIVANWKIFTKAGEPGWAAIVPLYNLYVLFKISMGNGWLFLLTFVPVVNFIMLIIVWFKLSSAFGHGVGFGFGLLFLTLIFLLILAFDSSEYVGA